MAWHVRQKRTKNRQKPLLMRKTRSQRTQAEVSTAFCFLMLRTWLSPHWAFIISERQLWPPLGEPLDPAKMLCLKREPLRWPQLLQADPGPNSWALSPKRWKNTKQTLNTGGWIFSGTRRSSKDSTTPLLSACSAISMLLRCGCPRAKGLLNGSFGFLCGLRSERRSWKEKGDWSDLVFESVPHLKNHHQAQWTDFVLFARRPKAGLCSRGTSYRACRHRAAASLIAAPTSPPRTACGTRSVPCEYRPPETSVCRSTRSAPAFVAHRCTSPLRSF